VLADRLWRRRGAVAAAAAFGVCFAQVGLTFGVAFTVLGYQRSRLTER